MALRKLLSSVCELYVNTHHPSLTKLCVRHKRGWRDQHVKQAVPKEVLENYRTSPLSAHTQSPFCGDYTADELLSARRYKYIHPEFLPNPDPELRDAVCMTLEREDMMKRRAKFDIPEFYVGSIMAVTMSDPYADGGESRFVGICIQRAETGLRHNFTLRNVIDGQGIEIMYEMYNPTLKKIEVLKLEKRLDEELLYLRDAPAIYSTIPFDLEATPHPKGAAVPINAIKIRLNPRPWRERWERYELNGVVGVEDQVKPASLAKSRSKAVQKPWEKYDLMKKYRESITEEDQDEAYVHFTREQNKLEREQAAELDRRITQEGVKSKK